MSFQNTKSVRYKTQENEKGSRSDISEAMVTLLVEQLAHELHNHNLYRSFANYFGSEGLHLLEEYYNLRAEEEYNHHKWISKYLSERGAVFNYPAVPEVKEITGYLEVLNETCVVEETTTNMIYGIVDLAQKESDWITYGWLMGNSESDGMLVMEQLEEESISNLAYDIGCQEGTWLEKQVAIYKAYKK